MYNHQVVQCRTKRAPGKRVPSVSQWMATQERKVQPKTGHLASPGMVQISQISLRTFVELRPTLCGHAFAFMRGPGVIRTTWIWTTGARVYMKIASMIVVSSTMFPVA